MPQSQDATTANESTMPQPPSFSGHPRVRPQSFPKRPVAKRELVLADARAGLPITPCTTVEHIVPRRWLRTIHPSVELHRDILNWVTLPARANQSRGSHKLGADWLPPRHLRGVYARASLYVAEIGPRAAEIVHDRVIAADIAAEWTVEWPVDSRELARGAHLANFQGAFVAREDVLGGIVWLVRPTTTVIFGEHLDTRWNSTAVADARVSTQCVPDDAAKHIYTDVSSSRA